MDTSKSAAYITHSAIQPTEVQWNIQVCYASTSS